MMSFDVFHFEGLFSASDILGVSDQIVASKLTLGVWIQEVHVLEGTTAHRNSRIPSHWASCGVN